MSRTSKSVAPSALHKLVLLILAALVHASCSDCNFEKKRVQAFIADPENQRCETDADCVAASVDCLELENAFCGQIPMSKRAEASEQWQQIRNDLSDCLSVDTCESCGAALVPQCGEDRRCD